jgi:hypothetical protein
VGFDGDVDEGIHYLKYDDAGPEEEQNEDEELGADV